ncbi:MAG: FG-GAP-like repeat-containing protein [candidate division Zixibacteria bacterium]|nr:FG-GAP-like repeat-containing protein [candidate division Zixibacteria bacterium]
MKRFLVLLLFVLAFSTPAFAQFDMQQIAVMQGARDTLRFGSSLAGVGDINQDGFEDLAVGQHGSNTFVYFGSENFDTIPDITFPFSSTYISSGDVNGDSIEDMLVAPFSFSAVWIYYGGTPFDTIPDKILATPYFEDRIATGDINKDGYDDVSIHGSPTNVYVYWGGIDMSTTPAYVLQGPPNYFGLDGLAIGDVNGDGYGDLAVSTSSHYPDDSTYIYFGGIQLDTIPRIKLKGGFVILGDVNGDGYKDLITVEGTYFGGSTIDSLIDSPLCIRGQSWAIGNFNKDKYEDLLLGVPTLAGGEAWIYLGSNPLDTIQDWHYYDSEVGDYGSQVSVADINSDGVDEAIVGDPGWWYNNPSYPPGRVYIYKNPYTAVEEERNPIPSHFSLYQNYPNPFNSSTIISFSLKAQGLMLKGPIQTTLIIYNILGQLVRTLVDEEKQPGDYQVVWDGKNEQGEAVGSGIYFYRIQAGSFTKTAKMSLLK